MSTEKNRGRRVVITGLGAVTPNGLDVPATWESVRAGRSGIEVLEGDEFEGLAVRIGGQVRGFDPDNYLEPRESRRLSRVLWHAVAAADEAMADAGEQLPWAPERFSIIAATGSGPIEAMQSATRSYDTRGTRAVRPYLSMHGAPDAAAALLSQRYGALGPVQGLSATCASGAIGLLEGLRRIRHGYADAVLVVGMEDCLNAVNLSSNANMRALAAGFEESPSRASRPFDRSRAGFVMAQGAAAILLEAADIAHARGAVPIAELAGAGASSDAHHATAPHPEARGAIAAIRAALTDAGIDASDVDHVNAHGTSTKLNDEMELRALTDVFGARAARIPISATKSTTGHLLGAGGALEAVFAALSIRDETLPATINLDDPEFPDFDFVAEARAADVRTVLSNSFGFGGHNCALVIRSPDIPAN